MNNNKIISFISPQYGTVGTDINYYKIAKDLSGRGNKIKLLVVGDEWALINNTKNIEVVNLLNRNIFNVLKNKYIHWKITLFIAILFSFLPFISYVLRNKNSSYLLGLVPIFPMFVFSILRIKTRIVFSIQGLPRSFVFGMNLYFAQFVRNIKLVIPNESMNHYINDRYKIPNKINFEVISNAVLDKTLIEQSNERVEEKLFADSNLKIITAVGRLTYQKNFDNLIMAFEKVSKSNSNARLIIIGEGEEYDTLNNMVKDLNLKGLVEFMGYKNNPYKYIKNSDLFVMSSRWEGPGHVLIEAMGIGCPVITTNCYSGPADTVQNGEFGIVVDIEDSNLLSESIIYALDNNDEMIVKLNKAKSYLERFHTKNVSNKYLKLFNY